MKKALYIVFFIVVSFSLNIIFYYFSGTYRTFLQNIKPEEETINIDKNYDIDISKQDFKKMKSSSWTSIKNTNKNSEYLQDLPKLKMTKIEDDLLLSFKEYNLKKMDLHSRLFDLTPEYPDEYYEYYSEYVTMYFFWTKPYDDILSIFETLTYELPFTINKSNIFWSKSFYINLKNDFKDDSVRIVFLYKSRIIWMKIKKTVYDNVKTKLDKLK